MRQLDRRPQPDEQVTEETVRDVSRLARLLSDVLRRIARREREWRPREIVHRDVAVDAGGTAIYAMPHGFSGRVNWTTVDWTGATAGPALVRDSSTDLDTLRVVSYQAGTVSVRIWEAG